MTLIEKLRQYSARLRGLFKATPVKSSADTVVPSVSPAANLIRTLDEESASLQQILDNASISPPIIGSASQRQQVQRQVPTPHTPQPAQQPLQTPPIQQPARTPDSQKPLPSPRPRLADQLRRAVARPEPTPMPQSQPSRQQTRAVAHPPPTQPGAKLSDSEGARLAQRFEVFQIDEQLKHKIQKLEGKMEKIPEAEKQQMVAKIKKLRDILGTSDDDKKIEKFEQYSREQAGRIKPRGNLHHEPTTPSPQRGASMGRE